MFRVGRCELCEASNVELVAALSADPDQKVCAECHADPRIPTTTADRPCTCGSGMESYWLYDGQGIELCRGCGDCENEKLRGYRTEILSPYTQADVDEPIEPE